MFFSLALLACTAPGASLDSKVSPDDTGVVEDTAEDIGTTDTAVADDSPCYPLEGHSGTGCYTTRPYIQNTFELAVPVYGGSSVSWDVTVEAAPEGWIGLNNLAGWLSFNDASGSGWTSEVMDGRLTYEDQYGDRHYIGVENSNPGGKSIVVGELVSAQGDWAVGSVDAGDTVVVTFSLNLEGLDVGSGDWIELDLNSYQEWSSAETSSTSSQFGAMPGTKFLFQE